MSPRDVRRIALLSTALLLAACGATEPTGSSPAASAGSATTEPSAAPDPAEVLAIGRGDLVEVPSELIVVDLVVGDGDEAVPGTRVTVQYVGVRWSDGGVFDASWTRGQPFTFTLGSTPAQVIAGWDQGVAGMRVGGRRVLTIPPHLAYGSRGAGSVIGPDETLVFAVDLVGVAAE